MDAHNQVVKQAAQATSLSQQTAAKVTSLPSLDVLQGGNSTQLRVGQASILPAHNTGWTYVATPSSITFYWDGTHGSQQIQIAWPDGTTSKVPLGYLTVMGLSPGATYLFYASYNVGLNVVQFAPVGAPQNCPNGIGTPPVAYLAASIFAAAAQDGDGVQPLSSGPVMVTLPTSGTTSGSLGGK